jgi:hypothetical protein
MQTISKNDIKDLLPKTTKFSCSIPVIFLHGQSADKAIDYIPQDELLIVMPKVNTLTESNISSFIISFYGLLNCKKRFLNVIEAVTKECRLGSANTLVCKPC